MIYNSTIGLEAAILGAPVLCAGRARFTQLPTVYFPQTQAAYREQLDAFLAAEKVTPQPEFQENARRFLYYQLFKSSLPFGEFIEDEKLWPGFVRLRKFSWQDLERSAAMRVLVQEIENLSRVDLPARADGGEDPNQTPVYSFLLDDEDADALK
jgi:hypothetical protein